MATIRSIFGVHVHFLHFLFYAAIISGVTKSLRQGGKLR